MFAPLNLSLPVSGVAGRRVRSHAGFTLIELLAVIAIIGILVGLLLPAVNAVRRSVYEGTVAADIEQLEGSVESFRKEFGFYPSDFSEFVDENGAPYGFNVAIPGPFNGVTVQGRLLQMLAKISPSHNELAADPVDPTRSRLQVWWETVGVNLAVFASGPADKQSRLRGPQIAMWFWMTQLFNDAQYPLTGQRFGVTTADADGNGIPDNEQIVGEQRRFHDFPAGQLQVLQDISYPNPGAAAVDHNLYQIARPIQRGGDAPLVYFHYQTYLDSATNVANGTNNVSTKIDFEQGNYGPGDAPNFGMACRVPGSDVAPTVANAADIQFVEVKKFQIITAGYDERFGDLESSAVYENQDNICNFSEGRLDVYVDDFNSN